MNVRTASSKRASEEIPDVVIQRLPLYARTLTQLEREGRPVTSSFELGRLLGSTPAQIRKDLSYFGRFGKQGTGYDIAFLQGRIREILGLNREWPMALVGVGRLGQAIARYPGFSAAGLRISALFDTDPEKIGKRVEGITIQSLEEMPAALKSRSIEIAILAVPSEVAQRVTDMLVEGAVKAILNYASVSLKAPPDIVIRSIDPVLVLQSMTYYLEGT